MRIGELARSLGISPDTIRFYERSGALPRASRDRDNDYRRYSADDVEHLRLLIELRRLDVPLPDAARIASWCHSGHCDEATTHLPSLLAERRSEIAGRIDALRMLDERLAQLERHLARPARALAVLDGSAAACCDAAASVAGGTCACCAPVGSAATAAAI